ncbi:hypothetical protein VP1G_06393 [Cytospora mali]|uniref:Uncharacterized protein n=1 Tax=Cytospora mali TaxID=578113 RepID=A0A194V5N8_CYTMA|nr:hypothetical protein VP1G_06393 [Valsa mali var. pyri (nom. inval.)]
MSLAAFRRHAQHDELAQLAESHFENDLTADDKVVLKEAASTISWQASVGSVAGLGLGCLLAYRVRSLRKSFFNEFKASDLPKQLTFASGKTIDVPDVSSKLAPSPLGDFAAYFLLGMGGLFLGGETGFLTGSSIAARRVRADADRTKRIEDAYRAFKIDALRQEANALEKGAPVW